MITMMKTAAKTTTSFGGGSNGANGIMNRDIDAKENEERSRNEKRVNSSVMRKNKNIATWLLWATVSTHAGLLP